MDALHSLTTPHNPPQTFLDKKPPLLPRQSTSDVLSFTHIIANRLSPGQNVWDFFSPPPDPDALSEHNSLLSPTSPTSITSPTLSQGKKFGHHQGVSTAPTTRSPSPATVSVSAQLPPLMISGISGRRQSSPNASKPRSSNGEQDEDDLSPTSVTAALEEQSPQQSSFNSLSSSPQPTAQNVDATATGEAAATARTTTTETTVRGSQTALGLGSESHAVTATMASPSTTAMPKLQKRRSFAQSLKSGMLSLTQMLSPTSASFNIAENNNNDNSDGVSNCSTVVSSPTRLNGSPHYNILVLGSDSAPLASTLYKMSSLLPAATKIRHYQEISGFFVAYFQSNGSFSCSPKTSTDHGERRTSEIKRTSAKAALLERKLSGFFEDEVKTCRRQHFSARNPEKKDDQGQGGEEENESVDESLVSKIPQGRSSEETLHQLKVSSSVEQEHEEVIVDDDNTSRETSNDGTASISDTLETRTEDIEDDGPSVHEYTSTEQKNYQEQEQEETQSERDHDPQPSANSNATLSVHAFSLDTTWPVPRILAQTFWFPYAHGIIYIVDATRKNDPRGIDHLLNARQFLNSLISDPFFKRRDIPVVVFANKAGLDPETCYRVDEIAEILGCEDWDVATSSSPTSSRPGGEEEGSGGGGMMAMMMRRTKSDEGHGKSATSQQQHQQQQQHRTRPWCVKSTRTDGAGDGLRESVEWLKSRMAEMAEDAATKVTESTRSVANKVKQFSLVQNYVIPTYNWLVQKFWQCPMVLRFALMTFGALSAIPLACFFGFIGMGGFAAFASLFLVPALGVALLLSCGLGTVGLVAYTCYRSLLYVIGIVSGPPAARGTQSKVEHAADQAHRTGHHMAGGAGSGGGF
ncbi:hypothetical protein BGZ83_003923 [Gryganskiella cystojenkinii]|nr:hypothetical protein BGZ83_003923 [Gryganskiella cystojenkinii]